MALPRTQRLTPELWAEAALALGAREGLAAINVERVASELGVTKGSAYHHYSSRAALLISALELWEQRATYKLIKEISSTPSPHDRLTAILEASMGRNPRDGLEYNILTSQDPHATPVIERVTVARLEFLEKIYREFGLNNADSRLWARTCYASYLGLQMLHHTLTDNTGIVDVAPADITAIARQLTPPTVTPHPNSSV